MPCRVSCKGKYYLLKYVWSRGTDPAGRAKHFAALLFLALLFPALQKHKRVCLELHSVVRMKMLYKRWKTFWTINNHVEVERTELTNELKERKGMNFRRRLSEIACKSPYAAMVETYIVVSDKEKRRLDLCR